MSIDKYNLPKYLKGKSFSEAAAELQSRFAERKDSTSQRTYKIFMERLRNYQEDMRTELGLNEQPQQEAQQQFNDGGIIPKLGDLTLQVSPFGTPSDTMTSLIDGIRNKQIKTMVDDNNTVNPDRQDSTLLNDILSMGRYAPIAGSLYNLATTKKPTPDRLNLYNTDFTPELVDVNPLQTSLAQDTAAARNAILSKSSGNASEYASQINSLQNTYNSAISDVLYKKQQSDTDTLNTAKRKNFDLENQNIGLTNQYNQLYNQDMAAYDDYMSNQTMGLVNNLAGLGTEALNKKQVDLLYGKDGAQRQLYQLLTLLDKTKQS